MKIGIEVPKQTIESLLNRANMFIMPIYIKELSKLQIDDEFCIQEYFFELSELVNEDFTYLVENNPRKDLGLYVYRNEYSESIQNEYQSWDDASQMTQEQSRYKGVVKNVEVKRVQDLSARKIRLLCDLFNWTDSTDPYRDFINWFNSQFDIKYEDNPYVFLYTVKEVK